MRFIEQRRTVEQTSAKSGESARPLAPEGGRERSRDGQDTRSSLGRTLLGLGKLGAPRDFLGKLPGDLHFRASRGTFYFPVTTCILVSVVVSLLPWLVRKGE